MNQLIIRTQAGSYPVYISSDELNLAGQRFSALGVSTDAVIVIITDENVNVVGHPQRIQTALTNVGYTVHIIAVEPGDGSKNLATVERLYNRLLDFGVRRNGVIVAVGGGVIGDLAGFVAATYLRGIRFVQVPTTLLAHDSSIGGKVGINLARGKNLVGAFHAPSAVLYDVSTLVTLPVREWRNGMAEVIKHGLIGQVELLHQLAERPYVKCPSAMEVSELLTRAMAVKIQVVEQDERESDLRMVLNVGHTVGHAVEQLSHYALGHGEAVAVGICVEAHIAVARGLLGEADRQLIEQLFSKHELPVSMPDYETMDVLRLIEVDKKHSASNWTFALPVELGNVTVVHDVTVEEVRQAIAKQR